MPYTPAEHNLRASTRSPPARPDSIARPPSPPEPDIVLMSYYFKIVDDFVQKLQINKLSKMTADAMSQTKNLKYLAELESQVRITLQMPNNSV